MQTVDDILYTYRRHPFAEGLLPFTAAVRGLETPYPRIYAKEEGKQRWVMYDKKTKQPALFSHAALMFGSDNEETGNYVPEGQHLASGVEPRFMQRRVNTKGFYTYIIDSYSDLSLYEGQWIMDDYMRSFDEFKALPRREYLSGQDPKYRARFWMQTPIFLRRGPGEPRVPAPTHLHPWIIQADNASKIFRANPDRPRLWVKAGEDITPLSEGSSKTLQRGDVVALSFTVTYHLTSIHWFAQFHPADIVVLRSGDGDGPDYSAPSLELYDRPAPSFDAGLVQDGEPDCYQYTEEDERRDVAEHNMAVNMDGILSGAPEGDEGDSGMLSMEIDDGVRSFGDDEGLPVLLEDPIDDHTEGYDMVGELEGAGDHTVEDFVDLMAEEVDELEEAGHVKRPTRSGARTGRAGRRRN